MYLIFGEVGDIIYGRIKYLPDISEAEEVVDVWTWVGEM